MHNPLHKLQTYVPAEFLFAAAALGVFFLVAFPSESLGPEANGATTAVGFNESRKNPYEELGLLAKAVYVYDAKAKRPLYSKNASEALPIASITKVMTALTALSLIPETTYITVSKGAISEEGDSGLRAGEQWLLRDLLALTLLESSNDGAAAVSEAVGKMFAPDTASVSDSRRVFIQKMNELAASLDLPSTRFWNESGLDLDATRPGALSSAEDTARFFSYATETFPGVFRETRWSEIHVGNGNGEAHAARNTNKSTDSLPLLIASKTGYTDLAGGNLAIAFDAGFNHPIIIVVLGSTQDGRFTDVQKLLWATLEYLTNH